jgi:hypothetical protein
VTEVVSSTSSNAGFTTHESAGWQRLAP